MRINEAGLNLIKEFEGLRLESYLCPAGVYTVGFGSTGPHVKPNMRITEEEADRLLRDDIKRFEDLVSKDLSHIELNSNQFSALVSICFNCGSAPIRPGMTIRKCLDRGDYQGAAEGFLLWVKAGGRTLQGLVRRRREERKLFLTPTYDTPEGSIKSKIIAIHHNTYVKDKPLQSSQLTKDSMKSYKEGTFIRVDKILGVDTGHYKFTIPENPTPLYIYVGHCEVFDQST